MTNVRSRFFPRTVLDVLSSDGKRSSDVMHTPQSAYEAAASILRLIKLPKYAEPLPFSAYREVGPEYPGLVISNPNARVFVEGDVSLKNFKISSVGECFVFLGKNCSLVNSEIASHAVSSVFFAGFDCRLDGVFSHTYAKQAAIVLAPGVTAQGGSNFCVQENSYVLMGDDCMLSTNVFIRTSDSHGIYDAKSLERINGASPVVLDRRVWISRACSLNKGVVIGEGAVVGQGSIVSGQLEGGCLYAGAPVKLVREGVLWDRRMESSLPESHRFEKNHFAATYRVNIEARMQGLEGGECKES